MKSELFIAKHDLTPHCETGRLQMIKTRSRVTDYFLLLPACGYALLRTTLPPAIHQLRRFGPSIAQVPVINCAGYGHQLRRFRWFRSSIAQDTVISCASSGHQLRRFRLSIAQVSVISCAGSGHQLRRFRSSVVNKKVLVSIDVRTCTQYCECYQNIKYKIASFSRTSMVNMS